MAPVPSSVGSSVKRAFAREHDLALSVESDHLDTDPVGPDFEHERSVSRQHGRRMPHHLDDVGGLGHCDRAYRRPRPRRRWRSRTGWSWFGLHRALLSLGLSVLSGSARARLVFVPCAVRAPVRDPPAGRFSGAVSSPWRRCGVGPHRRGRDVCIDVVPAGAADTGPWPVHRGYSVRRERRWRLCRRFSRVFLPARSSRSASLVTTIWSSSGFGPRR